MSFLRLSFSSSSTDIFFWRVSMDFHLISRRLPSGSTSVRLTAISCAKACAASLYSYLTKYSSMSLLSWSFCLLVRTIDQFN